MNRFEPACAQDMWAATCAFCTQEREREFVWFFPQATPCSQHFGGWGCRAFGCMHACGPCWLMGSLISRVTARSWGQWGLHICTSVFDTYAFPCEGVCVHLGSEQHMRREGQFFSSPLCLEPRPFLLIMLHLKQQVHPFCLLDLQPRRAQNMHWSGAVARWCTVHKAAGHVTVDLCSSCSLFTDCMHDCLMSGALTRAPFMCQSPPHPLHANLKRLLRGLRFVAVVRRVGILRTAVLALHAALMYTDSSSCCQLVDP